MAWLWVYVPHFAVAVARRQEPTLQEVSVVVEEAGRVRDCSPETWAQGVRPGQRLREAQTRCPETHVWTWDPAWAGGLWERVTEHLCSLSPTVRSHRWDAWGLTTGPDQDEALLIVQQVLQGARELVVPTQVGWAAGQFVASVAARVVEPGQACLVASGYETTFLGPLPLRHLPLSHQAQEELETLGIRTMGAFVRLPAASVGTRFGRQGLRAWRLAQGKEESLSLASVERPKVLVRWAIFDPPLEPDQTLRQALERLLGYLGAELQAQGLECQQVVLELVGELGGRMKVDHRPQELPGSPAGMVNLSEALLSQVHGVLDIADGRIAELKVLAQGLESQQGRQLSLFPAISSSQEAWHHAVVELAAQYPGCFWQGCRLDPHARLAWQRSVWRPFMNQGKEKR